MGGRVAVRVDGSADTMLRRAVEADDGAGEVGGWAIRCVHRTCRDGEARDGGLLESLRSGEPSGSLAADKFLLDAAFEESGFEAVGTDFAVDEFGIAFDPDERAAERRLVLGNFLGVENGVVGNLNIVVEAIQV